MKRLTLCADDFALSLASSWRILELIEHGRLSATSVMPQSVHWAALAPALAAQQASIDVGLHFNLTHPFDEHSRPLAYWLALSQARMLRKKWLKERLNAQLDLFDKHFQRLPDFIDGHQHVHAFPIVREALFEVIESYWGNAAKPYLRAPDHLAHSGDTVFKAAVLQRSCAGFGTAANAQQLQTPEWFAGLYSLSAKADFAGLMAQWMQAMPAQALVMCHPGCDEPGDPIGSAREHEYDYLRSSQFLESCERHQLCLARFSG